jgi:UV DNA damage endonuclease
VIDKMKVRLGYVAIALRLENCSPSKTVTVKTINQIDDSLDQKNRLIRIARENLANTLRILKANYYDNISVYRFTSKLIPLCTHPQFLSWDYISDLKDEFEQIGAFVKEHGMRVSLHPDHFTLLNSPKPEVQQASLCDLEYHRHVLEAMKLSTDAKLVMHVGGKYENKTLAIERFKTQFTSLPTELRSRIVLENDDRCFTAAEVLRLAKEIAVPMVLDIHHHQILNDGESVSDLLPEIFNTWGKETPKVHISSPKSLKEPRSHADFIEVDSVIRFLKVAQSLKKDFDLMVEAKQKDLALYKLGNDLKEYDFNLPTAGEIEIP